MSRTTIFQKLENLQPEDFRLWLGWMFAAGVVVLCSVFGTYVVFFSDQSLKIGTAEWGQFGDFIGGTANPLLGFLTLTSLILALVIQNRQLQVSSSELRLTREELELTRSELQRSARAQELSEKALSAQATSARMSSDLSALSFLREHYTAELDRYGSLVFMAQDPRRMRAEELKRRIAVLDKTADQIFHQVIERQIDG